MTPTMTASITSLKNLYYRIGRLEPSALWAALASAMATVLSSTGLMSLSAYLISFAALQPSVADIMVSVTAVRFFGIARAVFRYTERMVSHRAVFKMLSRLRTFIYSGVALLKGSELLKLEASELFATLSSDIEVLQDFYLRTLMPLGTSLGLSLVYAIVITWVHPIAGISYFLLFTAATLGVSSIVHANTRGLSATYTDLQRAYKTALNEFGEGYIDLLTNSRVSEYEMHLSEQEQQLEVLEYKIYKWRFFGSFVQQILLHLAVVLSALLAITSVIHGTLPGVLLATCILAVFTLFETAPNLLTLFQKLESAGNSASRIMSYSEGRAILNDEKANQLNIKPDSQIALHNVYAGYSANSMVLKDVTLSIPRGTKVAIVGESGSGKSTLAKLLTDFIDPSKGSVISNPEKIAMVDQQVYLFNKSLRDNLLLGNVNASDDELLQALKLADFEQDLQSLDDLIGLGGHTYSGGERQRIALARALLKNADYLLLDEAAAGLDAETESRVLREVFRHLHQNHMGFIWITHRLIHMEEMDMIYVLKEGSIYESGTHEMLIKKDGLYAKLYALQEDKQLAHRR